MLSHNAIERLERLDKLLRLRELHVAHNCLSRIEGLESLTGLQVLVLTANAIEHVPAWLPRKLQALRTLRIGDNRLASVSCSFSLLSLFFLSFSLSFSLFFFP